MKQDAVFGFVHGDIVDGLRAYGNWKTRQSAMDALLSVIETTNFNDGASLEIPEFLEFLLSLMDDPNFKIKQGSIQTMHLFLQKIGKDVECYLRDLVPKLASQLSDPKDYVREGCIGVFSAIAESIGAIKLVLLLKQAMATANFRTREEIVLLYIMALLTGAKEGGESGPVADYLVSIVMAVLKEAMLDGEGRVRGYAIEGLRLVFHKMTPTEFWALVVEGQKISDSLLDALRKRCQAGDPLPYLDEKGVVMIQSVETESAAGMIPAVQAKNDTLECRKSLLSSVASRAESRRHSSIAADSELTGSTCGLLDRRLSLRSHPLSERSSPERTTTDESNAENVPAVRNPSLEEFKQLEIDESAGAITIDLPKAVHGIPHRDRELAEDLAPKEEKGMGTSSADHQSLFRRLFESSTNLSPQIRSSRASKQLPRRSDPKRETPMSLTDPGESVTRDNSGNVAARIDRIARLIRERDEPRATIDKYFLKISLERSGVCDSSDLGSPLSKSASLATKKRENLHILKMKQKDRRTHSANAVLQRNETNGDSICRERETLPSILSKTNKKQSTLSRRPQKTSCFAEEDGSWTPTQRSATGRLAFAAASLFEDDADCDSPGFVSSPGSVIHTRPGTYASAISTSQKTGVCDVTETQPFIDPDAVLVSTVDRLKRANNAQKKEVDWVSQAEALNDARRLVYHHPTLVKKQKRDFVMAFAPALQQLRSTTTRTAILLCQDVFEALGDSLDHEVDDIVSPLVKKAGETSNAGRDTFLASEADKALSVMIRHVSVAKSLHVLLQHAGNTSKYVRCKVAAHLDDCLAFAASKLHADANLHLIDRLFKVGVGFLEEGSLETRTYGKRILWGLRGWINNRGAFQRLVGQLETESKRRRIRDVFDNNEGPPPLPAKCARTQTRQMSNGGSLTPLTPSLIPPGRISSRDSNGGTQSPMDRSLVLNGAEIDPPREEYTPEGARSSEVQVCVVRRPPKPTDRRRRCSPDSSTSEMPESMSEVLTRLTAKDWRTRIDALQQMDSMAGKLRNMTERDRLRIMDQLTYRLNDGNSKVVLVTLETLKSVFEKAGRSAIPALNSVIPAVVANLASSSEKIRTAADAAMDELTASVDSVYLVQTLSHCCAQGNPRTRAALLQKLESLTSTVQQRKPQLILKYILPVAFSSLSDIRLDVRQANAELLRHLAQTVGRPFIEQAEALTGTNRQRLFDILQGSF